MTLSRLQASASSLLAIFLLGLPLPAQEGQRPGPGKLYNLAKQKLLDGKQINGHTINTFDPKRYCEEAPHYDFTWFEMQHSVLTWGEISKMVAACPRVGATPMVRISDEFESSLQHATDIGLLGVIMPTVDTVEKALQTAKYSRYPPAGRRSQGGGQARAIWGVNGVDYRQTFNDNMLVVAMLETPTGVANAYEIARVPGIDVVIVGNSDMVNFSGLPEAHPQHQQLLTNARDAVIKAGKLFGMTHENFRSGQGREVHAARPVERWLEAPQRRAQIGIGSWISGSASTRLAMPRKFAFPASCTAPAGRANGFDHPKRLLSYATAGIE
jgi:2-keto-3-deoxy-L-rhamnonate aldolase RhmA